MAGGGASSAQDVDLNLAPLIDCFTVIVAFLLLSASFISIAIMDAGVPAISSKPGNEKDRPPVSIKLDLSDSGVFKLSVSGKQKKDSSFEQKKGEWDYEGLGVELKSFKEKWPMVKAITITAGDNVKYDDVVKTMGAVRKHIPGVLLGGF
jgi:biopolymer transport protein ExbD